MINYPSIAEGALSALADAGQPVTLTRKADPGPFIPGEPVVTGDLNYSGIGALLGYKQQHIDGVSILQGDQRLLLAPQIGVQPMAGDTVTASGRTFNVVACEVVAPAGVPVLYKLQLRGV